MSWTVRERFIALYPSTSKIGVALFKVDDGDVTHAAVGSIPRSYSECLLYRFKPDIVLVEAKREGRFPPAPIRVPDGLRVEYAHPDWQENYSGLPKWKWKAGPLAWQAWRMGFHEFVRRRKYGYSGSMEIVRYSQLWLDQHGRYKECQS